MDSVIGCKVKKKSGKPFKSKLKVNTIEGIIKHPYKENSIAYYFFEDDSCVSTELCEIIK